jgi:predicted nucleic acid-binding Zn finger protein
VTKESGNVSAIVSSNGIKLHLFEPSKREIWTVVGKENEYWLDPNLGYCSCDDYYYNAMETGRKCYHLQAVITAKEQGKVETIKFQDSEFESFISALIQDLI